MLELTQAGCFFDVVVVDVLVCGYAVEQQEDNGLERGDDQFLLPAREFRLDLAIGEGVLPVQRTALVFGFVVRFEFVDYGFDFRRDDDGNCRIGWPGCRGKNIDVEIERRLFPSLF